MTDSKSYTWQLRRIARITSGVAFFADLITVAIFLRNLFEKGTIVSFGNALSQVAIIVTIFVFAFALLIYSRVDFKDFDGLVWLFSCLYIAFSSAIFAIISYRFIVYGDYDLGEFIGYGLLILLIAGLGHSVASLIEKPTEYFAVPFMLVALEQIGLLVVQIFTRKALSFFSWVFIGNLLFFIYCSLFILFFIGFEKFKIIAIDFLKSIPNISKIKIAKDSFQSTDSKTEAEKTVAVNNSVDGNVKEAKAEK